LEEQANQANITGRVNMFSRKILYSGVLIVSALAFAVACTAAAVPLSAAAGGGPNSAPAASGLPQTSSTVERGITVVGGGKASGTPDVAHVNIGIDTEAASVQQAVSDNQAKMTALLEALKGLKIQDKDIQTTNYSVYTQQAPSPDGKTSTMPVSYHVSNQVDLTVRDVSQLSDILDKAVAAGANNIYGVSFSVDDTSKLEADARAKAVADAKARAASLAQLAGVELGDVVSLSEVIGNNGPVYAMAAGMGGGGTPIQPGELSVQMSVQVTFALK
jgi:uncharacterized protein